MKQILTSMAVGMVLGAGLVYSVMRGQPAHPPRVVASQQWCDLNHTVPFIPAKSNLRRLAQRCTCCYIGGARQRD
jgi:hypothetical protein